MTHSPDRIRLDQFLKRQGAVQTGGHAKVVIQNGEVTVNGEVETRRGRQLLTTDLVAYADEEWSVGDCA